MKTIITPTEIITIIPFTGIFILTIRRHNNTAYYEGIFTYTGITLYEYIAFVV